MSQTIVDDDDAAVRYQPSWHPDPGAWNMVDRSRHGTPDQGAQASLTFTGEYRVLCWSPRSPLIHICRVARDWNRGFWYGPIIGVRRLSHYHVRHRRSTYGDIHASLREQWRPIVQCVVLREARSNIRRAYYSYHKHEWDKPELFLVGLLPHRLWARDPRCSTIYYYSAPDFYLY